MWVWPKYIRDVAKNILYVQKQGRQASPLLTALKIDSTPKIGTA